MVSSFGYEIVVLHSIPEKSFQTYFFLIKTFPPVKLLSLHIFFLVGSQVNFKEFIAEKEWPKLHPKKMKIKHYFIFHKGHCQWPFK